MNRINRRGPSCWIPPGIRRRWRIGRRAPSGKGKMAGPSSPCEPRPACGAGPVFLNAGSHWRCPSTNAPAGSPQRRFLSPRFHPQPSATRRQQGTPQRRDRLQARCGVGKGTQYGGHVHRLHDGMGRIGLPPIAIGPIGGEHPKATCKDQGDDPWDPCTAKHPISGTHCKSPESAAPRGNAGPRRPYGKGRSQSSPHSRTTEKSVRPHPHPHLDPEHQPLGSPRSRTNTSESRPLDSYCRRRSTGRSSKVPGA